MIQFQCDYNEGAHPLIMQRLVETNMQQTVGYGRGQEADTPGLQQGRCGCALSGRGHTDQCHRHSTYSATLSGCDKCRHGARDGSHKVLAIDSADGKLTAAQIEQAVQAHVHEDGPEHMVQPGMVYISFPTEVGTIYTLGELRDISTVCRRHGLPLFVDGARLG